MPAFELGHRVLQVGDRRQAVQAVGRARILAARRRDCRSATVGNRIVEARNTGVLTAPSHLRGERPRCPTERRRACAASGHDGVASAKRVANAAAPARRSAARMSTTSASAGSSSAANCEGSSDGRHVLVMPRREPRRDRRLVALEIHDAHVAGALQAVAIRLLQRRAREHGMPAAGEDASHFVGDAVEPGPAIVVGRAACPRAIFATLAGRMKIVGIEKRPAERARERLANRRLAAAAYAHQHQDHVAFSSEASPIRSRAWYPLRDGPTVASILIARRRIRHTARRCDIAASVRRPGRARVQRSPDSPKRTLTVDEAQCRAERKRRRAARGASRHR